MPHGLFTEYLKSQRRQRRGPGLERRLEAWQRTRHSKLTPRQRKANEDLGEAFRQVQYSSQRYNEWKPSQLETKPPEKSVNVPNEWDIFLQDLADCDALILKALRLELSDHPLIEERRPVLAHIERLEKEYASQQEFMQAYLRKAEVVQALVPVPLGQVRFPKIHKDLTRKKVIRRMSQQGFRRWCLRHDLFAYADRRVPRATADHILWSLVKNGPQSRTRLSSLFGRHVSSQQITRALAFLDREGHIIMPHAPSTSTSNLRAPSAMSPRWGQPRGLAIGPVTFTTLT
jgi:hypothetical protein